MRGISLFVPPKHEHDIPDATLVEDEECRILVETQHRQKTREPQVSRYSSATIRQSGEHSATVFS